MKFHSIVFTFTLVLSSLALSIPWVSDNMVQHLFSGPSISSGPDVDLVGLHKHLVSIKSLSGQEQEVVSWLADYLASRGLTVELNKVEDSAERYNLYAYLGTTRNTKVVLTSHLDTVPPYLPYKVEEGGYIFGRGSCDAKGSVAAQVTAFLNLLDEGSIKEGDVSLLYVVGEEIGGDGMRTASKTLGAKWDTAIFGEPTENKLAIGHKGIALFDLKVTGKSCHSGYPELGIDADAMLVQILHKLLFETSWPVSDLLGNSTVNAGQISGGVAANVISSEAHAKVLIRVAEDIDTVEKLIYEAIAPFKEYTDITFHSKEDATYLDYKVEGFENYIAAYSTDVPFLVTGSNLTRYLYGPGSIMVAHGPDEMVKVSDLQDSVDGYKRLVSVSL
ncbi:BA75_01415T0 [Komagataella pastoris]|uniref:BA75_01415T0 n=1 Tax=Komagataella pastoris TaxID=4922 RepID=A0A1B2J7C4_PICPA|nr:BA75_01415T0 [Komagataella pastoris]